MHLVCFLSRNENRVDITEVTHTGDCLVSPESILCSLCVHVACSLEHMSPQSAQGTHLMLFCFALLLAATLLALALTLTLALYQHMSSVIFASFSNIGP
jgi:hypothetical protein